MIIGRHAVAPETVLSCSYYECTDGCPGYRVIIERRGLQDITQWAINEETAKKLIAEAEKAIKEGEVIRAEAQVWEGDDDDE